MTLRTLAIVVWFVCFVVYAGSYIEARRGRPHLGYRAHAALVGLAIGSAVFLVLLGSGVLPS